MHYGIDITRKNRVLFQGFLDKFSLEELNKVPKGFRNNIIWNIAHCIVTQQLLIYKLSGLEGVLSDKMISEYRKGTKTERNLSQSEVDEIRNLLFIPLDQTEVDYNARAFKNYKEYTVSTGSTLISVDEALVFNNFHEGIHLGYILALFFELKSRIFRDPKFQINAQAIAGILDNVGSSKLKYKNPRIMIQLINNPMMPVTTKIKSSVDVFLLLRFANAQ